MPFAVNDEPDAQQGCCKKRCFKGGNDGGEGHEASEGGATITSRVPGGLLLVSTII